MRGARLRPAVNVAALALLVAARPAWTQSVDGAAGGFNAQRLVYSQGLTLEQTGMMVGGSGALHLGRFSVGLSGWMGTLKGDGSAGNPDVKARTTAASLHVRAVPGVQLGVQYEVRRFEANVGTTVWTMMGANAQLELGLGVRGLQGLVDVSLLPASSVEGGPKLTMAVQTRVGVILAPWRFPLNLRLSYRFERYDVESGGSAGQRYEQFGGIVAEAGIRLGR